MAAIDVEKHVAKFATKLVQAVVQSRAKHKVDTKCDPNAIAYFGLALDEDPAVQAEINNAMGCMPDKDILNRLPICVEISIENDDGEKIVIELWSLSFEKFDGDQLNDREIERKSKNAYSRLRESLISILTISRAMVGHRLAQDQQQPDGYCTYYSIYVGQPHSSDLGADPRKEIVSEVVLPNGTLQLSVAMRVQMTEITSKDKSTELRNDNLIINKDAQSILNTNISQPIDIDKPIGPLLFETPSDIKATLEDEPLFNDWWLTRSHSSISSLNSRTCDSPLSNKLPTRRDSANSKTNSVSSVSEVNALNVSVNSLFISMPKKKSVNSISSAAHSFDDDKLLKASQLPFIQPNSQNRELAEFLQDCINAPHWNELNTSNINDETSQQQQSSSTCQKTTTTTTTTSSQNDCEDSNLATDDVSKRLEAFESSLEHYESLFAQYELLETSDSRPNSAGLPMLAK